MPFHIIRDDITHLNCDAIVNASNSALVPGGGVDAAIHAAAGPRLAEACRKLGGCPTGEARLTRGYKLKCKYVIHTVGPVWQGGNKGEQTLLESCYHNSLGLALQRHCRSVAFPLISAHAFGYPKDQALRVAVDCIGAFLKEHEMQVYLVVFGQNEFRVGSELFPDIKSYIDDNYVYTHLDADMEHSRQVYMDTYTDGAPMSAEKPHFFSTPHLTEKPSATDEAVTAEKIPAPNANLPSTAVPTHAFRSAKTKQQFKAKGSTVALQEALWKLDESFQQMLLRKIDEKGMTDAECYKKANIDRKLFSKIRKDVHYKPSKSTALAFAIALELSLTETQELLMKAGYALSHSSKFDVIIEYFIIRANYNIFEINEALFAFDQNLLGA